MALRWGISAISDLPPVDTDCADRLLMTGAGQSVERVHYRGADGGGLHRPHPRPHRPAPGELRSLSGRLAVSANLSLLLRWPVTAPRCRRGLDRLLPPRQEPGGPQLPGARPPRPGYPRPCLFLPRGPSVGPGTVRAGLQTGRWSRREWGVGGRGRGLQRGEHRSSSRGSLLLSHCRRSGANATLCAGAH